MTQPNVPYDYQYYLSVLLVSDVIIVDRGIVIKKILRYYFKHWPSG